MNGRKDTHTWLYFRHYFIFMTVLLQWNTDELLCVFFLFLLFFLVKIVLLSS